MFSLFIDLLVLLIDIMTRINRDWNFREVEVSIAAPFTTSTKGMRQKDKRERKTGI